jgi:hypothetical protein
VRWSSAGVIVLGVVTIVAALLWSLVSRELSAALSGISRDLATAVSYVGANGLLALVGVVLVAVGVGASLRARRATRAAEQSSAPAPVGTPAESPDPQVV